jgi:integrase/recombinase XerD
MVFKLPETITEEELIKIMKYSKPNQRIAYALGFYECMRISEIINLKKEDIDINRKLLYIKQGKGNKDRNIPIAPEVIGGLRNIPVPYGIRALQIAFKKQTKKVLGKDLHFHQLRHSGITHYLTKKKWNTSQVQQLAGHSKIATTQIYTHINPEHLVSQMWGDNNGKT